VEVHAGRPWIGATHARVGHQCRGRHRRLAAWGTGAGPPDATGGVHRAGRTWILHALRAPVRVHRRSGPPQDDLTGRGREPSLGAVAEPGFRSAQTGADLMDRRIPAADPPKSIRRHVSRGRASPKMPAAPTQRGEGYPWL